MSLSPLNSSRDFIACCFVLSFQTRPFMFPVMPSLSLCLHNVGSDLFCLFRYDKSHVSTQELRLFNNRKFSYVCLYWRALHIEQADLAVAPLADHLAAGGAGAWVTGAGAGVRAAGWAGLRTALLTHLTLQRDEIRWSNQQNCCE